MFNQKEYQKRWYRENNREKIRERNKQYNKDNSELKKRQNLKRNYDLSYKDWSKMWRSQDGKCAICEKSFDKPSDVHVDHNHRTKKIRDLLCGKCNRGIGHFNDNPELTTKATEYLLRWCCN